MSRLRQIQVTGPREDRFDEILTDDALRLAADLDDLFAERRCELLAARRERQADIAGGAELDFLPETKEIRSDDSWRVASPAPGLVDRRVEITGPIDAKMAVNALNSGASVWMADLEDATSPTWSNVVGGQLNLVDVLERRIDFTAADGKEYRLGEQLPTIVLRPRGWHLSEKHMCVDGRPVSASLFDVALYLTHCASRQLSRASGPYLYLPKLENHLEARLWNDVLTAAEQTLGLPSGTVRTTVLIETITAAFEMDEILYELRDRAAGLNAGRWDYVFSIIKQLRERGEAYVLPDRADVTMTAPFMRAYTELLVQTCHRRGAHAIGGMSAFVPSRRDENATERALARVRADKEREAAAGFDGSWVAHPDLVPVCREAFDAELAERPHQLDRRRDEVEVTAYDLLDVGSTPGARTMAGLRTNVRVALTYLDAWLGGTGAVAIDGLMEDLATAEISRSQVWQWCRYAVTLDDGTKVTPELVREIVAELCAGGAVGGVSAAGGPVGISERARLLFEEAALGEPDPDGAGDGFPAFLSCAGYARHLTTCTT
jgi:malate synthase